MDKLEARKGYQYRYIFIGGCWVQDGLNLSYSKNTDKIEKRRKKAIAKPQAVFSVP